MMTALEHELRHRKVKFDRFQQRIRCVLEIKADINISDSYCILISRCFPHIVNLAYHAVLAAITMLKYAEDDADDYDPNDENADVLQLLNGDPIAILQSLIHTVCVFTLG